MQHAPGFLKLVEEKRRGVTEVTLDEIRPRLPARDLHLLDVREESEWGAGHIPSARHLGKGVIERDIERLIPDRDAEIVLYCGGGFRSVLAADALQQMGYRRVRSLVGGYRAWTEAGLPVEKPLTRSPPMTTPQHILVATDLDETSLPALRMAVALAQPLGARITLLHVVEPFASPPGLEAYALEGMPTDWEQRVERGRLAAVQRRLDQLVAEHRRAGLAIEAKVLTGLLPGALTEAAQELGADLLVLGTHGRSGVAHFLLGSVAEKVVRAAPCPVLTVRPR